ncbi:MAG: hypothetical protein R3C56_32930 [Pirellulaceae bacterium]
MVGTGDASASANAVTLHKPLPQSTALLPPERPSTTLADRRDTKATAAITEANNAQPAKSDPVNTFPNIML